MVARRKSIFSLSIFIILFACLLLTPYIASGSSVETPDCVTASPADTQNVVDSGDSSTSDPLWLKTLSIVCAPLLSFCGAIVGVKLTSKQQVQERKSAVNDQFFYDAFQIILAELNSFKHDISSESSYLKCYNAHKRKLNSLTDQIAVWNLELASDNNDELKVSTLLNDLDPNKISKNGTDRLKENACSIIDSFINKAMRARKSR